MRLPEPAGLAAVSETNLAEHGSLAQLAEHLAVNQGVAGSSPAGIASAGYSGSVGVADAPH